MDPADCMGNRKQAFDLGDCSEQRHRRIDVE
jgi:hypothetical protein